VLSLVVNPPWLLNRAMGSTTTVDADLEHRIRQTIADLDDDRFSTRERASGSWTCGWKIPRLGLRWANSISHALLQNETSFRGARGRCNHC